MSSISFHPSSSPTQSILTFPTDHLASSALDGQKGVAP
jgi:hypothetical protein